MAPPPDNPPIGGFRQRIYSSLALAPIVLGALYLGAPVFEALLGCLAVIMAWEWTRMCAGGRFGLAGFGAVAAMVAALAASGIGRHDLGVAAAVLGAGLVLIIGASSGPGPRLLMAAGPLVIGLSCVALSWSRATPETGLPTTTWLIGAVWTTDIAAYFTGRRIGGPRLAPRISPKKTWSGLAGAIICTACWGGMWGLGQGLDATLALAGLGAATAMVAQGGDLGISALKRRFGVKDASDLIPGHGGVLDRFDGFVFASPAYAFYIWATEGMAWPLL